MSKDIKKFVDSCIGCQRSKITRHIKSPLQVYTLPSKRFEHINIDLIGPLPLCNDFRYCLTIIDKYSRWPAAIPIQDMTAETVVQHLMSGWIANYGVPAKILSDLGRQFESNLIAELMPTLGIKHFRTTAYHPQANGIIENWHQTLKAAIMCYKNNNWMQVLPTILLGLRSTFKSDLNSTPAKIVYGETLRLPGQFFTDILNTKIQSDFVKELKIRMDSIRPVQTNFHSKQSILIHPKLENCTRVFIRVDSVKPALTPPYEGPIKIIKCFKKYFIIEKKQKQVKVSIDRVKPAFTTQNSDEIIIPSITVTTKSGRSKPPPVRFS